MQDLTLSSSTQNKYFLLKRIGEEDIEISNQERMVILKALHDNVRYVQIRDYTLMLNAIKSIDPKPREYEQVDYFLPEPEFTDKDRAKALKRLTTVKKMFDAKIEGGEF